MSAFEPTKGLVIIAARIYGPSGDKIIRLALDTGSLGTIISPLHISEIGYDLSQTSRSVRLVTASSEETASRITMTRLDVLGQQQTNIPIVCHTLPAATKVDGLIGLDFIRRQRLVVDFRTGQITLE